METYRIALTIYDIYIYVNRGIYNVFIRMVLFVDSDSKDRVSASYQNFVWHMHPESIDVCTSK